MGMFSGLFGDSTDDSAENYLSQALQQYANVQNPSVASETVSNLPQETVQGSVNPEQQQGILQGSSALNNIQLDPENQQAQENALGGYQDIADAGGLDANAKLAIQEANQAANVQSQGAQGAIQQSAQAEGQGGGINALVLRGQAAQGASNTAATEGMQAAAEAEANKENALSQMATIGNAAQNTQYNQASNTAASQNAINANNTGIQNQVQATNVANNMAAQGTNVANAQGVNAANTAASQNQAYYNAQLPQQQFNNALQKAQGASGVLQQQGTIAAQAGQNQANSSGQLLKGLGTAAATYYGGAAGGSAAGSLFGGSGTTGSAPPASANTQQYAPLQSGAAGTMKAVPSSNFAEGGEVGDPNADVLQHIIDKYHGKTDVPGPESGPVISNKPDGSKGLSWYETAAQGMKVPGKAEVDGDSPKNDKVPAMLSPGEIVIKRSKAKDPDAAAQEAKKISMEDLTKGYRKGK